VPRRRPPQQRRFLARAGAAQLAQQGLAEQPVVSIPRPPGVQRHQEQVGAFQLGEDPRRVAPIEHEVAERAGQPVQHRGTQQEVALFGRQAVDHLRGEVVDHMPVTVHRPGQAREPAGRAAQGQRHQLETRRPAL
jgi:hypothetical protein